MIARKAAGSFRDALGTLEQLVTYGGKEVALETCSSTLGVADAELILETTEALVADGPEGRAAGACKRWPSPAATTTQFMRDLAAHLRHLS